MLRESPLSNEFLTSVANMSFAITEFFGATFSSNKGEQSAVPLTTLKAISEDAHIVGTLALNILASQVFKDLHMLYEAEFFEVRLEERVLPDSIDIFEQVIDKLSEECARLLMQCFLQRTVAAYIQCLVRSPKKTAMLGHVLVVAKVREDTSEMKNNFQGYFGAAQLQKSISHMELVSAFLTDPLDSFTKHIEELQKIPCLDVTSTILKGLVELRGDSRMEKNRAKIEVDAELQRIKETKETERM